MARVRTVPDRREAPPKRREPAGERSPDHGQPEKKISKTHHHDELRLLQDSLTTFFTPTAGRRCRALPKKFTEDEDRSTSKVKTGEDENVHDEPMEPLCIDTSCMATSSGERLPDENMSLCSYGKSPAVSPVRKVCEKLMDSLSPYFSATSEKRTQRKSSRGENFVFPGETSQAATANNGLLSPGAAVGGPPRKMKGRKGEDLKKVLGGCGRSTQNSASSALFGSPVDHTPRSSSETVSPSKDDPLPNKRFKSGSRLKIPKKEPIDDEYPEALPPSAATAMKERKKKKTSDLSALSPSSSGMGEKENLDSMGHINGEISVSEKSLKRFRLAQKMTQEAVEEAMKDFVDTSAPEKEPHWPRAIRIGKYEIKTWFSAPFPQEYSTTPILHICEFCLHYGKSAQALAHHRVKCDFHNPPGNEIYRKDKVSVFEVDGNNSRIYCQNLCLIAKLFLDHKTLYYDVEPFLFYVATTNDDYGFHLVGYFSKEKYSTQKFNLSCIVTLPCYQKQGFGRFLIDFSFLLSRREGMLGSPERPLSELGRISYASYWRTAVFEWLYEFDKQRKALIPDVASGTGISLYDIVEMLDALQWFQKGIDGVELNINWSMVEAQFKKAKADKARIWLDEAALRWVPVHHSPTKDFGMRSPVRLSTPHRSPTTANVGSTPTGVSIAAVGSTIKKGSGPPKSSKKKAARRKLALANKKTTPPSTSGSSSSEDEAAHSKLSCKESTKRTIRKDSSPEGSEKDKKPKKGNKNNNGIIGRQTNNSASTSVTFARRTSNRGKGIYEGDISSSSSSPSEEDYKDESFSIGGNKGKKPHKGKNPPAPRRKRVPPKRPGKSPGKVFPPDYGKIELAPEPSSPVGRCESVASSATVPMRMDEPFTPGGGRSLNDVDDDYRPAPAPFCDIALSTSPIHPSHRSSRSSFRREHLSSSESSRMHTPVRRYPSDSSSSRPHSPIIRTLSSTPPVGGHEPQQMIMNMGGIPDEEADSRCGPMSVESDQPPQLHAFIGTSNEDAPPLLPPEHLGEAPPLLVAGEGYNTDDDEAPPQLSPVSNANEVDNEVDPDTQPMAPLTEEQRQFMAMDLPPKAPIKQMDDEHMNPFDTSAQSIMEPSSSKSMLQGTPQNTYPGSLKQTTPGSVPSCSIPNQTTPEMQQAPFMSPGIQIMQPNSVSSVHGVQPSGTIDQGWVPAAPQSDPSTPLRNVHSAGSFGSPPGAVQMPGVVQPMRASVDAPTSSRRSGEGSRKRNQQQQPQPPPQQPQQLQHPQFGAQQYPMQMNPLNPMQQYMQQQYQPYAPGYGFDPASYQHAAAANQFWQGYANTHYGKTNGAAMVPGGMMPPAMMYPSYPNGVNNMVAAQNAYRQAAAVYPNSAGFNTAPAQFPPSFNLNYPGNPPFYYK